MLYVNFIQHFWELGSGLNCLNHDYCNVIFINSYHCIIIIDYYHFIAIITSRVLGDCWAPYDWLFDRCLKPWITWTITDSSDSKSFVCSPLWFLHCNLAHQYNHSLYFQYHLHCLTYLALLFINKLPFTHYVYWLIKLSNFNFHVHFVGETRSETYPLD